MIEPTINNTMAMADPHEHRPRQSTSLRSSSSWSNDSSDGKSEAGSEGGKKTEDELGSSRAGEVDLLRRGGYGRRRTDLRDDSDDLVARIRTARGMFVGKKPTRT